MVVGHRRSTDFYDEGWLIWLDVDTQIRQLTNGQKSIDDFTHLFHGGESTAPMLRPYTFDDVTAALNQVAPYDWAGFLSARVNEPTLHAPLDGLTKGGWRLVYTDARNDYIRAAETEARHLDEAYSIGLRLRSTDGVVTDVLPGFAGGEGGHRTSGDADSRCQRRPIFGGRLSARRSRDSKTAVGATDAQRPE